MLAGPLSTHDFPAEYQPLDRRRAFTRRDGLGRGIRRCIVAAALVVPALPLAARAQMPVADSSARGSEPSLFTPSDLYVAGGFAVATIALSPLDRHVAEQLQRATVQDNRTLGRVSTAVRFFGGPGPFVIGGAAYAVGRLGHIPRLADLALHATEAVVIGAAVGGLVKGVAGRSRPYVTADTNPRDFRIGRGFTSDDYTSFPSGHTTAAFSAAAAVVTETFAWWPGSVWYVAPAMYGGATLVGLSRMYDNKHWASDVAVGAAIGTFSGLKTVRFNHTHAGNRLDRILLGATVAPAPGGGASASWVIPW